MQRASHMWSSLASLVKPWECQTPRAVMIALLSLAVGMSIPFTLSGQENVGAIIGVIHDPTAAVVAGATVTARLVSTGIITEVKSNAAGAYAFPLLQIGEYTITA